MPAGMRGLKVKNFSVRPSWEKGVVLRSLASQWLLSTGEHGKELSHQGQERGISPWALSSSTHSKHSDLLSGRHRSGLHAGI